MLNLFVCQCTIVVYEPYGNEVNAFFISFFLRRFMKCLEDCAKYMSLLYSPGKEALAGTLQIE